MNLKPKLTTLVSGSVSYEKWLKCFSSLQSSVSEHVASALDLCFMDKVLEDLNHSDRPPWVFALLAVEDLHTLIDQALQNYKTR